MLVSIITACFNSSNSIVHTIDSVNTQSYQKIEHIFVDGASTDNTCDIILSNSNRRTRLISEKDQGLYFAMNKGIKESKGDIIFILNSDDIFYNSDSVENIVEVFKNKNAEIVYSGMLVSKQNNFEKIIRKWIPKKYPKTGFSSGWHPPHPGFVVRKDVYSRYGLFDTELKIASDFEIMLRFMQRHKCLSEHYPHPIVIMQDGGKSSKIKGIIDGAIDITKAFKKNNIKFNLINYFFLRYLGKIIQYINK